MSEMARGQTQYKPWTRPPLSHRECELGATLAIDLEGKLELVLRSPGSRLLTCRFTDLVTRQSCYSETAYPRRKPTTRIGHKDDR